MIDINLIRENPDLVKASLKKRGQDTGVVDELTQLDAEWKKLTTSVETMRAEQKELGNKKDLEGAKALKEKVQSEEEKLKTATEKRNELLLNIPNTLFKDVPEGKDESENKILRTWGKKPDFHFEPKDHVELGKGLDVIDNERAAKVTGARFTFLKGGAALLQMALIKWTIDQLTSKETVKEIAEKIGVSEKPFTLVFPPVMINEESYRKMARLTDEDKEQRYHIEKDDLYLIGSSEHTMGAMHMDETLEEHELPLRYLGYSTNFRREAGSYGKDTKGILRMHQFDKLEMESFTKAVDGAKEQEFFLATQEHLVQKLGLPYQVVANCAGDTGTPDARQFDIEIWMPGQDKYRETHSADYMTDYQARRLNTRLKKADGGKEFVHMNDATAFAIGRTLIAIMENYQTKEGTVVVPEVLRPYLNGLEVIE